MKKALALLLALVMVVAMAACGSKTTTPSTNAATTPAPAGNETEAQVEASELKVGVFYYTFADTYISSVRTALDAQLDSLGVTYQQLRRQQQPDHPERADPDRCHRRLQPAGRQHGHFRLPRRCQRDHLRWQTAPPLSSSTAPSRLTARKAPS